MKSKFNLTFSVTLILISLGSFYPFVHNYVIFGNYKVIASILSLVLLSAIILNSKNYKILLPSMNFNLLIIFILAYFLFLIIFRGDNSLLLVIFYIIVSYSTLVIVLNTNQIEYLLKKFIQLNIIMGFISVLGVIYFNFSGIQLINIIPYQGDYNIYNYGFFFIKRTQEITFELRPSGYYDEPGSFAFVVMLLLLINRKFLKNKKFELGLILSPLISLSVAHFVTVLLYLFLFNINKKNIKNVFYLLSICILILVVFSKTKNNPIVSYIEQRTVNRFESIASGTDESRQGGFELGPQIFAKYPFGISKQIVEEKYPSFVNETIWAPLVYYGILGFLIYYIPFIYILFRVIHNRNVEEFKYLIIIAANLIQRPFYIYPIFIVLIYIIFFYKYHNEKIIANS